MPRRRPLLPSFLCSSQESGRRASAGREVSFQPRTWAGWIPVTSTGMRAEIGCMLVHHASQPKDDARETDCRNARQNNARGLPR
ncbi:MAG TPA: hypothetical protein DEQ45_07960 [Agrobacterium sp.]|nr:hypothetical protein [Agrobacterium sp.]